MNFGMDTVMNTVTRPPTNANNCVCQVFMYSKIDSAAPTHAPYETPSKSGETRGFWNTPWYDAPDSARDAPTRNAAHTRGKRMFMMTL